MKPINIYALTRIDNSQDIERLERQMSKRNRFLKIKKWEIAGLRSFSAHLSEVVEDSEALAFFYSFTMPKLGKEFDLLRVNDDIVVNIELKSGNVSEDMIRRQLIQNKYYLSTLSKNMYFYTFISNQNRLVRLSNSGRLVDCEWEELGKVIERQENCYDGNIEELFKEDRYLISPLTDPGRFLRQEYFLTLQQKDIRKSIFKNIRHNDGHIKREFSVQGFTGLPGTGKTILLYDIAMQLSKGQRVCVLHFGSLEKELEQLDERLKRVDFYYCDDIREIIIDKAVSNNFIEETTSKKIETIENKNILTLHNDYSAILIDEGHRINECSLSAILDFARQCKVPVIFSYDKEDAIVPEERYSGGAELIEGIEGYMRYKLTNRIRMNSELSSFIACVMCVHGRNYRHDYPSVSLVYANDDKEAEILLQNFERDGYIYIWDDGVDTLAATCKEFDKVVMMIDDTFHYDENGFLRNKDIVDNNSRVRNLYHGLSRAKKNIAIVVKENLTVFEKLLYILQR